MAFTPKPIRRTMRRRFRFSGKAFAATAISIRSMWVLASKPCPRWK